jgi:hypothetical protein
MPEQPGLIGEKRRATGAPGGQIQFELFPAIFPITPGAIERV